MAASVWVSSSVEGHERLRWGQRQEEPALSPVGGTSEPKCATRSNGCVRMVFENKETKTTPNVSQNWY